MENLTIENYWKPRVSAVREAGATLIKGWSYVNSGWPTFLEAPLGLSADFVVSADTISNCSIIIVSAPGAVGKSTLAKQIAYQTNAIYIDLAEADAVGGNTLSGGLFRSGLGNSWHAGQTAVLIDGLDEARLRVTQEAFEAFISDVGTVAANRGIPTILFGRTGAAEEAYLALALNGVEAPILEIGFYGVEAAVHFAMARIRAAKPDSSSENAERKAVQGLIEGLRTQTDSDGDRFAGYAPVLQAIADRVGLASNPQSLVADIERGERPITLEYVTSAILDRERGKLKALPFSDPVVGRELYWKDEQLDRLAGRVYGVKADRVLNLKPEDARIYDDALRTWVEEHPFLNGNGKPSSAVFDAIIAAWALKHKSVELASAALKYELKRGAASNPFLPEFYIDGVEDGGVPYIPPEHVGVLYNSLRARLSRGDIASLHIESENESNDKKVLKAEIEIAIVRRKDTNMRMLKFSTEQTNPIYLGSHVSNVDISAPSGIIDIGQGPEATFVAPVTIHCSKLVFRIEKIIAESVSQKGSIYLEAEEMSGDDIISVPILRGDVELAVSWPDAQKHPWTAFASKPTRVEDPKEEEALRRFRKFIIAFRSHSKGGLARYRDKLEHDRMTKGTGQSVLNALKTEGIISLVGAMYYLHPEILTTKTGASFHSCASKNYNDQTRLFIRKVIGG